MDIEMLIEQLRWWADHCDRTNYGCHARTFLLDAATALSTLQAENEKLRAELEQVKRERDVAIEQLHGHCPACAHYTPNHNEGLCRFCCFEVARNTNVEINDNWEWRGQKED